MRTENNIRSLRLSFYDISAVEIPIYQSDSRELAGHLSTFFAVANQAGKVEMRMR